MTSSTLLPLRKDSSKRKQFPLTASSASILRTSKYDRMQFLAGGSSPPPPCSSSHFALHQRRNFALLSASSSSHVVEGRSESSTMQFVWQASIVEMGACVKYMNTRSVASPPTSSTTTSLRVCVCSIFNAYRNNFFWGSQRDVPLLSIDDNQEQGGEKRFQLLAQWSVTFVFSPKGEIFRIGRIKRRKPCKKGGVADRNRFQPD